MNINVQTIANNLEREICPIHGEHATATVEGIEKIKLVACCDDFKDTLTEIYKQQLTDQARNGMIDEINSMFKQFRK